MDSIFDCLESRLPSKAQLRKASMENDVASARLFVRYIDACIEDVLAVKNNSGAPKPFSGLFGSVAAYYGMMETQGGGTLHAHFLIWLNNVPHNTSEYDALINDDAAHKHLVSSIEKYSASVVTNTIPLQVCAHCCKTCGASYENFESVHIPPTAHMAAENSPVLRDF